MIWKAPEPKTGEIFMDLQPSNAVQRVAKPPPPTFICSDRRPDCSESPKFDVIYA